jgi:hypothetical protein
LKKGPETNREHRSWGFKILGHTPSRGYKFGRRLQVTAPHCTSLYLATHWPCAVFRSPKEAKA